MAVLTADFERGTSGTDILTTDQGSATAFDRRSVGGSSTLKYDTAHSAFGVLGAKFAPVAGGLCYIGWNQPLGVTLTNHYGRFYFYAAANPAAVTPIWNAGKTSDVSRQARFDINADGTIRILDNPATGIQSGSVPIALNQLIRIEYHVIHSASVGQIEVKLFNNPHSNVASEVITSPASWNTGADTDRIIYGYVASDVTWTYWIDNIVANATSYPGPVTIPTADFNRGADGRNITAADDGSTTRWDSVTINAGSGATYSNLHSVSGSLSGKFGVAGASGTEFATWTNAFGTTTDHYGRLYLWIDAYDASRIAFARFATAANANACALWVNSNGTLSIVNNANSAVGTTIALVALGQWVRIEWHIVHSTTVGQAEIKLFNEASSWNPTEVVLTAANKNFAADAQRLDLGITVALSTSGIIAYLDDVIAGATSYPGPVDSFAASQSSGFAVLGKGAY